MTDDDYYSVLEVVAALFEAKGGDYNKTVALEDYFPFGEMSYVQMLHMKTLRLRSLLEVPTPTFEGKIDTLYDLINYAIFMIVFLENSK